MALFKLADIAIKRSLAEHARFGFYPRPFDPEAMAVEAKPGRYGDIFAIAVIAVAGIARRLGKQGRLDMFGQPEV